MQNKRKFNLKPIPSAVGWIVGGAGALVLFVLLVKWGWNTFFADVLGFHSIDWVQTLALCFWIALVVVVYIGGKETGK